MPEIMIKKDAWLQLIEQVGKRASENTLEPGDPDRLTYEKAHLEIATEAWNEIAQGRDEAELAQVSLHHKTIYTNRLVDLLTSRSRHTTRQ